jgi:CRISPR-associated endonuclease Cas1
VVDQAIAALATVATLEALMGHEGAAARAYFDRLAAVVGGDDEGPLMKGRSRRPPSDPVNAALSFGYSLLVSDCIAAVWRVGLDPDLGFLHQPVPGRPALALDLMEPFRPLIVDSVVMRMFGNRQLRRSDFSRVGPAWRMHDRPRRELIGAYERRLDELVTHPVFDYRISYRRVLELEARLLGRVLTGELPDWSPLVTR